MNIIDVYRTIRIHPWPSARRSVWREGWRLRGSATSVWLDGPGNPTGNVQRPFSPEIEDVLANDWEVFGRGDE